MNNKSSNDMERICWQLAKDYFNAMDKSHIIRSIEYTANKRMNETNELDSEEPQRIG